MRRLNRTALLTIALLIWADLARAATDQKSNFFYILEAEILGGYSKIAGKHGIGSTQDRWALSPIFRITDTLHWIHLYDGSYNRSSQVVSQDEGGRRTNKTQGHNFSTALKADVTKKWFLQPTAYLNWSFVTETKDEKFDQGLYDYRDRGGSLTSVWTLSESAERRDRLSLGVNAFERTYPNYQSLLSLFDPNGGPETNEKDFIGYKTSLGRDSQARDRWSWVIEGIFFYKDYTDKKTVNADGIRAGDTREDFQTFLNLNGSHPLNPDLRLGLDGQWVLNASNLDFYDTHNTSTLADDNFIKDYFDYFSFTLRPSLNFSKEIKKAEFLSWGLSYGFTLQHYPGRKAQEASGVYGSEDQEDLSHAFAVRVSYPLTRTVSWTTVVTYTMTRSNQKFETTYLYTYDSFSALTGFSFKY